MYQEQQRDYLVNMLIEENMLFTELHEDLHRKTPRDDR